jgi:2-polyprenyl-6-methoxyphenol hydroxylase-like FAD-dependent oxidoreductase
VPLTEEVLGLIPHRARMGISMVFAPKGHSLILHCMEFPWRQDGAGEEGIGGNDTALLARWPGLLFDNTRDHVNWGFSAAAARMPADLLERRGGELVRLVLEATRSWHPDLRRLFQLADPSTAFPINIRTSVPIAAWAPSPVTLLGDAIHTMTPGRGVGANTALRDAALLVRALTAVRDGRAELTDAIGAYEQRMRAYGFAAVRSSRKQMSGDDPIHKPLAGRVVLAGMRAGLRLTAALPPLRRRAAAGMLEYRGAGRQEDELPLPRQPAPAGAPPRP